MVIMKPSPTDNEDVPHRYRNLVALTGLTASQVRTIYLMTRHQLPSCSGRPWSLPLPARVLLVLIHLRTNLTTGALAAMFGTSQSTIDRVLHHLVPVPAGALRPVPATSDHPWIIDATLIPVHDQSITAISKNYRRSVNTQIIICAHARRVVAAGRCWPGNRNDVVVARATVAHLLTSHEILGDGGYRGIATITTPRRDHTGRIIHDEHYRTHHRIRARVKHILARLKDWQILRQCRRRGETTTSTSSPDSGTSRPTNHYGSTLSRGQCPLMIRTRSGFMACSCDPQ
jgi:hypothetical protein